MNKTNATKIALMLSVVIVALIAIGGIRNENDAKQQKVTSHGMPQGCRTLCTGEDLCCLKLEKKHVQHAEERWEANRRGFRVWCDVNGTLYVYRKKN